MAVEIKSARDIEAIRVASRMAVESLMLVSTKIRPGMTTQEIDTIVHDDTLKKRAYPAPLNYHGFPKSCCTSVNHVVCHGIPGGQVLHDGDIVNVDVTTRFEGMYGDTSAMFYVGKPSQEAIHVTEVARHCLALGIAEVREGARLGDIGAAIVEFAHAQGCTSVRDFCGHGIGRRFHEEPSVAHYGERGKGLRLKAGMVFTIEPMINLGGYQVEVLDDKWTAVTCDGTLSAQFEHTLAVTKTGCDILSTRPGPLEHSEIFSEYAFKLVI